ncbi:MAG: hypothetical protein KF821_09765 [Anaerolineales bacterium]|nr:hypothetical protein [Anaerolineales bacterium]MBX3006096.1 hypothetical protein [Anaerolineales bacterium]MCW5838726.1 hypothetical protein [Anaerolineales bacterium]MCW5887234.1 hypothetical protein [Anaerolineales bacterium]
MSLRKLFALGLGLMGFIFLLQGLGLTASLFPSFMDNDLRWSLVGIVALLAALFLWPRKR